MLHIGKTLHCSELPKFTFESKRDVHHEGIISHFVITCALGPYREDCIDTISDGSRIHDYLWNHSMRVGCLGKLSGLIYRITDCMKRLFFGRSDKISALFEIQGIIKTSDKTETMVRKEADKILQSMLNHYDIFVAISRGWVRGR